MGQKVSPIGLRMGINKTWESKWYADNKDFAKFLDKDVKIRKFLSKRLKDASVSSILIERNPKVTNIIINTAKPGVVIGHGGEEIEKLKKEVAKLADENIQISIKEVKNPDLDAALVAENIARQIEGRVSFRIAQKRAIRNTMKAGAKGCKVQVSGVIDGANTMGRTEKYMEGSLPLHTLRADVDYAETAAYTNYGKLGIKCWIYKGEILSKQSIKEDKNNVNA